MYACVCMHTCVCTLGACSCEQLELQAHTLLKGVCIHTRRASGSPVPEANFCIPILASVRWGMGDMRLVTYDGPSPGGLVFGTSKLELYFTKNGGNSRGF